MGVMENLKNNVALSQQKAKQVSECWTEGVQQNELYYVHVHFPFSAGLGPLGDVKIELPRSYKKFMVASCTNAEQNNSLYFHLLPVGKNPIYEAQGGNNIVPLGTEEWISLKAGPANNELGATNLLKFAKGIREFYLDGSFSVGAASWDVTILCANDDFDIVTRICDQF